MAQDNFDPYGFSEIEKIQQEIEDDLKHAWGEEPPAETKTETDAESSPVYEQPVEEDATAADTFDTAEDANLFAGEVMLTVEEEKEKPLARETFYHETIKDIPRPKRYRPFRKLAMVVCLICTLGTGTLGLGIGVAIPLTQHYLLGGINDKKSGDALNENVPYGIESTSYVFGDGAEAVPRDGALSDVIKLVEPSVVRISPVFESTDQNAVSATQTGEASGIIFSEDNKKVYIATNYHVVSGASLVNVYVTGKGPFRAKLVGRDAEADLAVISIDKKDLQNAGVNQISIAVFGDSDVMEVGDVVLAIGNAMGEGNSATSGIISAKEKTIPIQNRALIVLQTDAAINPGNSGGPLVNTRGEVIGINTAKLSDYYYAVEGMGYSISSNVAKPILEELMNTGPRPFLGIEGETVTEEMAEQFNIPPIGVLIRGVFSGTGAEKAGILRTDIITSFNGNAVFSMEQLAEEVRKCKIGDAIEVKILREGNTPMTLTITLGEYNLDNF